jgi:hypothetical protein
VRVADSTPAEYGRSRETVKRSGLAGWAEYGYCASHSRFFWGLRLHLVCTLHGLPVAFALTAAIWHNDHTGHPVMRALTVYDHWTPWNRSSSLPEERPAMHVSVEGAARRGGGLADSRHDVPACSGQHRQARRAAR